MESSHTSNSNATNAAADKPDELVSSGDIRQMNAAQVQHGEPVTQAALQQLNQQPKKCLHHRIFDASAGNMVNERVAALTNALLQQANQQNLSQGPQITQRPFPMQQQPIPQQQPQQTHIIRPHQQMQQFQQYAMQQMPTSIGINNSMMQTNAGTHFSVGISNQTANPSTSSTNGSIIHNQNGLVQQMNAALLAERYLLLDLVEGSTLYKCIDVKTHEELVCKGDLHSYVRVRKRLREPEAKRLFRQMCEVVKSCHEQGIVLRDLKLRKFVFADAERFDISAQQYDQSGGYVYEKPAQRFDLPQPVQQYDQDGGYVYEKPVQRFELPQPMQQYDQDGGYVYEKPVQRFDLPQPTTPAPIQSTYLPPTTRRPTPPQTPKPSGYFYPAPTIRFDLPQKIVTTQKPFVQSTYLPPTTPAPKYIPPKQGYSYPKPAVRFDLPQKIVTTPKPFVQSTYLPPTTKAPKVEGYVYPKPTIRFDLPAPIRSTYLPPTTTTTRKPTTSAPKYIPPKVEGYVYEKPAIRFDLPAPIQSTYLPPTTTTTTPKPTTSAPKYIPPKEGYSYPKPAIRFDLPSPIQSTYLPPTTTTPKPKEGYSYPKPVVRLELPSTYLPPTTTTTSTTPAPTYLPPRFQTPESDGYFYPQPQITFEF